MRCQLPHDCGSESPLGVDSGPGEGGSEGALGAREPYKYIYIYIILWDEFIEMCLFNKCRERFDKGKTKRGKDLYTVYCLLCTVYYKLCPVHCALYIAVCAVYCAL